MTDYLIKKAVRAVERGWIPDTLIRFGIRRLCSERLSAQQENEQRLGSGAIDGMVDFMGHGPVAVRTAEANEQHYEQPTDLFVHTLGPRLKYSSCYWPDGVETLAQAEECSLDETCRRAQIADGMDILELGCGWGSLTLWMATRYPNCQVTAVSNSATQRTHIEAAAKEQGLANIQVITADINAFETSSRFDRVVSIEMFEHMNNYRELLKRVSEWMRSDGRLFIHVFAHKRYAYRYEAEGAGDWMAQNFFTGGVMPSADLLTKFPENVRLVEQWWWGGQHYSRTAEAWLKNMAANKDPLLRALASTCGSADAELWYQRWRMFYLACAELWGYRQGQEWGVAHYLFEPQKAGEADAPVPDMLSTTEKALA